VTVGRWRGTAEGRPGWEGGVPAAWNNEPFGMMPR
jgi:hypothetical protein